MVIKQKKELIHATVSPYIKKEVEKLVDCEEFSSMSDLLIIVLAVFIGAYKREHKDTKLGSSSSKNDVLIVIKDIIEYLFLLKPTVLINLNI